MLRHATERHGTHSGQLHPAEAGTDMLDEYIERTSFQSMGFGGSRAEPRFLRFVDPLPFPCADDDIPPFHYDRQRGVLVENE